MLWRATGRAFDWLFTKSAEARRNAHKPLLRLVPWLIVAFAWIGLTLASVIAYYASVLPDPKLARQAMILRLPPNLTILARGGEFIGERGMRRAYVAYKDIPPAMIKAVLATEDRRFFLPFRPRSDRSPARRWQELALRRSHPGRLYDHAAAREEPLS